MAPHAPAKLAELQAVVADEKRLVASLLVLRVKLQRAAKAYAHAVAVDMAEDALTDEADSHETMAGSASGELAGVIPGKKKEESDPMATQKDLSLIHI